MRKKIIDNLKFTGDRLSELFAANDTINKNLRQIYRGIANTLSTRSSISNLPDMDFKDFIEFIENANLEKPLKQILDEYGFDASEIYHKIFDEMYRSIPSRVNEFMNVINYIWIENVPSAKKTLNDSIAKHTR